MTVDTWAKELATQLQYISHGQWLYRNMMVHDRAVSNIVMRQKEEIWQALEEQKELGEEEVVEEDRHLLEIKLDDLEAATGVEQTYWLLALHAARAARQLSEKPQHGGVIGGT